MRLTQTEIGNALLAIVAAGLLVAIVGTAHSLMQRWAGRLAGRRWAAAAVRCPVCMARPGRGCISKTTGRADGLIHGARIATFDNDPNSPYLKHYELR